MNTKLNTINFEQLADYNDGNSLMLLNIIFPDMEREEIVRDVDQWLHEIKLITDKHVKDVKFLTGNMMGEDGRKDYLIEFDSAASPINPIQRLQYANMLKWTSDFINNYSADYDASFYQCAIKE